MPNAIQIELDDAQIDDVRRAFPELDPLVAAPALAYFAVSEVISLFAGRKRYLSLSHQYVEWLEQLNVKLLPEVEFTAGRLMNQLSLPPGSAGYIARVLRDRQNVELMKRGWSGLLAAFQAAKGDHDEHAPKGTVGSFLSITLTKREYRLLMLVLDALEAEQLKKSRTQRVSINLPDISETRLDYIKIKYTIQDVERIIPLLQARI
jgi:hypothetical protein